MILTDINERVTGWISESLWFRLSIPESFLTVANLEPKLTIPWALLSLCLNPRCNPNTRKGTFWPTVNGVLLSSSQGQKLCLPLEFWMVFRRSRKSNSPPGPFFLPFLLFFLLESSENASAAFWSFVIKNSMSSKIWFNICWN